MLQACKEVFHEVVDNYRVIMANVSGNVIERGYLYVHMC